MILIKTQTNNHLRMRIKNIFTVRRWTGNLVKGNNVRHSWSESRVLRAGSRAAIHWGLSTRCAQDLLFSLTVYGTPLEKLPSHPHGHPEALEWGKKSCISLYTVRFRCCMFAWVCDFTGSRNKMYRNTKLYFQLEDTDLYLFNWIGIEFSEIWDTHSILTISKKYKI